MTFGRPPTRVELAGFLDRGKSFLSRTALQWMARCRVECLLDTEQRLTVAGVWWLGFAEQLREVRFVEVMLALQRAAEHPIVCSPKPHHRAIRHPRAGQCQYCRGHHGDRGHCPFGAVMKTENPGSRLDASPAHENSSLLGLAR